MAEGGKMTPKETLEVQYCLLEWFKMDFGFEWLQQTGQNFLTHGWNFVALIPDNFTKLQETINNKEVWHFYNN